MAKKVGSHKRNIGGMEAPRNSLEVPIEKSYGIYSGRDNILYAYHVNKDISEKNCCSTEAPMKKLIREEITKGRNTRHGAPSVVARLMGVEYDTKPAPQLIETKTETPVGKLGRSTKGPTGHDSSSLNSLSQLDSSSFALGEDRDSDEYYSQGKSDKPKPRVHPQEEELQKFKKEFEAWQAVRFKECSKVIEFEGGPNQLIAQEELLREKMFLYVKSKRENHERLLEPKDIPVESAPYEMRSDRFSDEAKDSLCSSRSSRRDGRASQLMNLHEEHDDISAPTKIVILRPGPEGTGIDEDSWHSSPSSSEDRGSIKDFLEEVKERLRSELQGKSSPRASTVRGRGIETPYSEMPSEPRQIAQRIAQQVRESVTRDFGMNLLRSESTRSHRSDIQYGTGSPEYINRYTRRFLTEKLRNVLKGETHGEISVVSHDTSGLMLPDYRKSRSRAGNSRDVHLEREMDYPESIATVLKKQSSFRRRDFGEVEMSHQDLSPRNLIRSMSAPLSGTSFGKLLLEDRNMLTGAQIRRKHEAVKKVPLNAKKPKGRFNIREKVSSFRYSLTLRGRLFHRRVQSIEGSNPNKTDLSRDISSGPTAMKNFYTHENSTEVPPSPASVCSSVHEDFWRTTDYSSPASSSGIHYMEDYETPHDFREINSNLSELRRKLSQFEGTVPAETIIDEQPAEAELDLQDEAQAYIRDLLVASGLYNGSGNISLSKWDPLGKPISNQVFEEVEETYRQLDKENDTCKQDEEETLNHKLLLALLNEALPAILKPSTNMSRYMQTANGRDHAPPCGSKLLFQVWEALKSHVHPPADRFYFDLDNVLARDLKRDNWSRLIDDDAVAIGRDIECQITGDLLDEIMEDMP